MIELGSNNNKWNDTSVLWAAYGFIHFIFIYVITSIITQIADANQRECCCVSTDAGLMDWLDCLTSVSHLP